MRLRIGLSSKKESLSHVLREPDGVTWLDREHFATADEGDLDGGSRGFTVYNKSRRIVRKSRGLVENLVTAIGHCPEERSENKGNEPENVAWAEYDGQGLLFVGSERSSVIAVYQTSPGHPRFRQVLPASVGPEGLLPIPKRGLFVAASEVDNRDDKIRSVLNIYRLEYGPPDLSDPEVGQSAGRAAHTVGGAIGPGHGPSSAVEALQRLRQLLREIADLHNQPAAQTRAHHTGSRDSRSPRDARGQSFG